MSVAADAALNLTAYATGWEAGEQVDIELIFPDGTPLPWVSGTASSAGVASMTLTHAGLAAGVYSVQATGDKGGKASAALVSAAPK